MTRRKQMLKPQTKSADEGESTSRPDDQEEDDGSRTNEEESELNRRDEIDDDEENSTSTAYKNSVVLNGSHSPMLGRITSEDILSLHCTLCEHRSANVSDLQTHTLASHTPKLDTTMDVSATPTYQCHVCSHKSTSALQLQSHVADHFAVRTNRHSCGACAKEYNYPDDLLAHQIGQHTAHACTICHPVRCFAELAQLRSHMKDVHALRKEKWKCDTCTNVCFDSRYLLNEHINALHTSPVSAPLTAASTPIVGMSTPILTSINAFTPVTSPFASPQDFINSFANSLVSVPTPSKTPITTPQKAEKCMVCDEKFDTFEELTRHKLERHCKVKFSDKCRVCNASLKLLNDFFTHSVEHNSKNQAGKAVSCVICGQTLISPAELESHGAFHLQIKTLSADLSPHNNNQKTHSCHKCPYTTKNEEALKMHIAKMHVQAITNRCHLCLTICDSADQLQLHLIEHSFAGQEEIKCYICADIFDDLSKLHQHLSQHSEDDKPFSCSACSQKFFYRTELDNHALTHIQSNGNVAHSVGTIVPKAIADEKPYIHHTNRKMRASSSHTSSEPTVKKGAYACQHCPKSFHSLAALQGHSHVHMTPVRNHHCLHCNKSFTTAAKLRNHQRQHRDGSPFYCSICGRSFSRKDNLKVHYRTHQRKVFGSPGTEDSSSPPPTMIQLPGDSSLLAN